MKRGHPKQMSESFLTAAFLSLSGGLQDAYTYIYRGHVFANAQTGNIVLLSQSIAERNWTQTLEYLIPLSFFAFGIAAAELLRFRYQNTTRIHWRQLVLLFEIAILFAVGFMPERHRFLCLCDAGTDLPQGQRLFLCQHHVYRQSAQRNGIPVCLLENTESNKSSKILLLLGHHPDVCYRRRARRLLRRRVWGAGNLDFLPSAFGQLPVHVREGGHGRV